MRATGEGHSLVMDHGTGAPALRAHSQGVLVHRWWVRIGRYQPSRAPSGAPRRAQSTGAARSYSGTASELGVRKRSNWGTHRGLAGEAFAFMLMTAITTGGVGHFVAWCTHWVCC